MTSSQAQPHVLHVPDKTTSATARSFITMPLKAASTFLHAFLLLATMVQRLLTRPLGRKNAAI